MSWSVPTASFKPASQSEQGMNIATLDDLATCISSQGLTSGTLYAMQARVYSSAAVSNLYYSCAAAEVGGTALQNLMGVYDPDGQTLVAQTGDLSNAGTAGNWTTTGSNKVTPCVMTPTAKMIAAGYCWIMALAVFATTAPSLRAAGASIGSGAMSTTVPRSGVAGTAATALPANFAPGALTVGAALSLGVGLA